MDFFEKPILNSPYKYPSQHWELDEAGQPTQSVNDARRPSSLITPVPSAKARRRKSGRDDDQMDMVLDAGDDLSSTEQEYNISGYINEIRELVDQWRRLPNERDWQVTAETAQLLRYWRSHEFETIRPFFCQVEAVVKWLGIFSCHCPDCIKASWAVAHLSASVLRWKDFDVEPA